MFRKNFGQIASSESLHWVGFLLLLGHLMTFFFVMPEGVFYLSNTVNPQCWSYFPDCKILHVPAKFFWIVYFGAYLSLTIFGLICSYRGKKQNSFQALIAVTFMKFLFLFIDRNFMGNYHFMHILYSLVYLFFPQKELSLKILLAWFYIAAGSLKLNLEWLSGAAVGGGPKFLPPLLQMWSYAYVVVLELLVVWGLFAKKIWIRWVSFSQFFIFHLVSFYWVGFFYPAIVLSLLMIFPFSWLSPNREKWLFPKATTSLLIVLSVFQLVTFASNKDSAIYSHRRLLTMNMYDARSVCSMSFLLHQEGKTAVYNPDLKPFGVRVRCDTNLVLNYAKNMCAESERTKNFRQLDISMLSKRFTDDSFTEIYKIYDACPKIENISYIDWLWGEVQ